MEAFSSPDSYGLVLLLILVTYALSAAPGASWEASLVLAVQIATVWVTLRASRARRSVRVIASIALAAAALAAVANLLFHDQIHGGIVASWASCLLYLIAPVSIIRHLVVRRTVDSETVLGAIAAYLMAGMFFAFLYHALGLSQTAAAVLRVPGPRHALAGPVLLVHHAYHHRVRQPRPRREPGPDLRRARDAERSAVPGHGGGQGRQCLATGARKRRTARELRRRITARPSGPPAAVHQGMRHRRRARRALPRRAHRGRTVAVADGFYREHP